MSRIPEQLPTSIDQYPTLLRSLEKKRPEPRNRILRGLYQIDLFFLLFCGLHRYDAYRPWIFDRCREVQADPNGWLDLWAREHYKSTIITFALTIQDLLNDPELTFGIFSHTRPIAKGFLRQIKRELETNDDLKALFPDILWQEPQRQSPKWSEDEGLVLIRRTNPKEATIEASGLVDGQPTSKHFSRMVYDDVVTRESVTTPEMITKTTDAWALSRNLGAEGGTVRYIGTRYHYNDTYREIINRGAATPRIHPATVEGTMDGQPVLLTPERLAEKRREQGPYIFGCQMLQDPKADKSQGFLQDWLRFVETDIDPAGMNVYMTVDPASEKKKDSDYTAIWVLGLGADRNLYVLDMIRDRLNLKERADAVFALHRRWKPISIGYEKYGMMADIEHIRDRQVRETYRFDIIELGGQTPKVDRIKRLIPWFEQGRIWLPQSVYKIDYEDVSRELVDLFVNEEFLAFPVGLHDDMLDALSRILDDDMNTIWPMIEDESDDRYAKKRRGQRRRSWRAA